MTETKEKSTPKVKVQAPAKSPGPKTSSKRQVTFVMNGPGISEGKSGTRYKHIKDVYLVKGKKNTRWICTVDEGEFDHQIGEDGEVTGKNILGKL